MYSEYRALLITTIYLHEYLLQTLEIEQTMLICLSKLLKYTRYYKGPIAFNN